MPPLPQLVRERWPDLSGPGVVAVSGGADSVALLRTLATWVTPVVVAHLNHRLRGEASDADEQFVRDLAATLDLPFRTTAIDVGEQAQHAGANLEETARKLRYEWLAQVAADVKTDWIATGHTADDQAETVLHRMLRGSGIQGLRGIARERELRPGLRLIRPLLHSRRADVTAYLTAIGQSWREDQSNSDLAFTRNRIRHELLPLLRTFNPAIEEVLGRLAEQASDLHDGESAAAHELLEKAELPRAGELRIFDVKVLIVASPSCVQAMFRLLWEREGWPRKDMTYEHWKRLGAVARGEETATDFPGGISVRRNANVLQVGRRR